MSNLYVYHLSTPDTPNKVLTHSDDIASTLAEQGIRFERWQPASRIEAGATQAEVIATYQEQIDQRMSEGGYLTVDVLSVNHDHPQKAELRARLFDEHHQAGNQLHLFAAGRGLLALHINDYVYAVLCEKNDVISIPAGTAHWFDMGENPRVVAIRLFSTSQGWAPNFTGDDIANRFPQFED
ncbi:acireductone dioxygenase [Pseudomonas sp. CCM 7891]|uniref:Acireductone dioxygenase n=1 Tax=Pseudomonas karstica TaxID=1055468 RepID=A0A7X2RSQ0_9PSED|nr:acireductone dioxygenase [Pseudomonas karstica]MTD19539.1 acireductone dioxygenase [Pseudomonas karstica]